MLPSSPELETLPAGIPFYQRHLLQFGTSNADGEPNKEEEAIAALAWVIRHFVGLVVERPKTFWHSMHLGRAVQDYITASDLAFTVLLLEHHAMEWRSQIQYTRETGKPATLLEKGHHLLYKDGIAGEEAKARFHQLTTHFQLNFYNRSSSPQRQVQGRMTCLRDHLKQLVAADSNNVKMNIDNHGHFVGKTPMKDLQDDILHRVFYYMNS